MAIISEPNTYFTNSHVLLKFGPQKAIISPWGDYCQYGPNRVIEGTVDFTTVTAGNTLIVSDVTFFPALASGQLFIEQVEAIAEIGLTGGTSISLGLVDSDRATVPTNYGTAFINAGLTATLATAGNKVTYTAGSTGAGGLLGSSAAVQTPVVPDLVNSYYITATAAGTFTGGKIRFRIFYHALDAAITQ